MATQSSTATLADLIRRLLSATAPQPVSFDERQRTLDRLDRIARLMDASFVIPGLNRRAGLDSVIGLIPGVGDFAAGAVSAYLVFEARRLGAPGWLLAKMVGNIAVDTLAGVIPGIGDLFDVAFKANMRNVALLRRHFGIEAGHDAPAAYRRSSRDGHGPIIDVEPIRRS